MLTTPVDIFWFGMLVATIALISGSILESPVVGAFAGLMYLFLALAGLINGIGLGLMDIPVVAIVGAFGFGILVEAALDWRG